MGREEQVELVAIVTLTVMVWVGWALTFFFVMPSWAFSVVSPDLGAAVAFGTTTVAWVVLALRHRVPFRRAIPVLLAGSAASAVWLAALWLGVALVPLAIHAMLFFAIPLALIPLLLWGAFSVSWFLSRYAVRVCALQK